MVLLLLALVIKRRRTTKKPSERRTRPPPPPTTPVEDAGSASEHHSTTSENSTVIYINELQENRLPNYCGVHTLEGVSLDDDFRQHHAIDAKLYCSDDCVSDDDDASKTGIVSVWSVPVGCMWDDVSIASSRPIEV